MPKVVVVGSRRDPVADIAAFLRERGVAAAPSFIDACDFESGFGASYGIPDAIEAGGSAHGLSVGSPDARAANRCAVAVCWGGGAAYVNGPASGIFATTVVVAGSTKQDVISACIDSDADYGVLWPKEKELLVTVVKAEMGGAETSAEPGIGVPRVGISSVKSAGATLLAGNLASEVSSRGGSVCILDCDTRFAELTEFLFDGAKRPDAAVELEGWVRRGSVPSVAEAVYTAVSGSPTELLSKTDTDLGIADCDLVLADVPGRELEAAFVQGGPKEGPLFDHFLLVVPLDYFGLRRARRIFEALDGCLVETQAAAVLCAYRTSGPAPEEALQLLGGRRFFELPWIPEVAGSAIDEGRLLAPSDRSPIGRVLEEIVAWVSGGYASDVSGSYASELEAAFEISGRRFAGHRGGKCEWPSV